VGVRDIGWGLAGVRIFNGLGPLTEAGRCNLTVSENTTTNRGCHVRPPLIINFELILRCGFSNRLG